MSTNIELPASSLDRRGFLRLGSLVAASAAVLAACGGEGNGVGPEVIPQSGTAAPKPTAPEVVVNDALLLRTATSLHHNGVDLINGLEKLGALGVVADGAKAYRDILKTQAAALSEAVASIDGVPFDGPNPVVNAKIVVPALALVEGSDSKEDDGARLVHAFVTLAATAHQSIVASLSEPGLRMAAMQIGSVHAKASTILAAVISPDAVVSAADIQAASPEILAPAEQEAEEGAALPAVPVYQVPGAFGALSPVQVVLGNSTKTEEGKRVQLGIDTPSFNSFILDGQTP